MIQAGHCHITNTQRHPFLGKEKKKIDKTEGTQSHASPHTQIKGKSCIWEKFLLERPVFISLLSKGLSCCDISDKYLGTALWLLISIAESFEKKQFFAFLQSYTEENFLLEILVSLVFTATKPPYISGSINHPFPVQMHLCEKKQKKTKVSEGGGSILYTPSTFKNSKTSKEFKTLHTIYSS